MARPTKHTDPKTLQRPADPPLTAVAAKPVDTPPAAITTPAVCCKTCTYGQDISFGIGGRRCRALPPQAHYLSRFYGDGPSSGVNAIGMWPVVKDTDSCGAWQSMEA